eukprot:CAMPEP_0183438470 /NCGR_PEP_ID=MMETSP0370-20130417/77402_1 /TAXON_ID=268820 /ORGANISM="Peridinium aciculiferum, Strain PAER-2" /LENGTH=169 /DNA_ID=CAMNT_0025626697 /DNA_START=402 /DNA_END=909 /DNA_ORIENTATION=-
MVDPAAETRLRQLDASECWDRPLAADLPVPGGACPSPQMNFVEAAGCVGTRDSDTCVKALGAAVSPLSKCPRRAPLGRSAARTVDSHSPRSGKPPRQCSDQQKAAPAQPDGASDLGGQDRLTGTLSPNSPPSRVIKRHNRTALDGGSTPKERADFDEEPSPRCSAPRSS